MAIQRQNFTWPQTTQGEGLSRSLRGLCIEEHILVEHSRQFYKLHLSRVLPHLENSKTGEDDRRASRSSHWKYFQWLRKNFSATRNIGVADLNKIMQKRPDFHGTGKQCAHARTPWLLTYDPHLCCFILHPSYSNRNSNHNGSVKMIAAWPSQLYSSNFSACSANQVKFSAPLL